MGKYDTAKLRNLGIVAHNSAGKTSLVEAMLFNTGMTKKLGKVDDGSSSMDFEEEEIKRQATLSASLNHCMWQDHSLHLVDTPGVSNFLHDTRRCLRVLGGAVVIVSAISGTKAQTKQIWGWCDQFEVPRIAFVNKMDKERANFLKAVDDMEKSLGARAVVVTMPIGAEEDFKGTIDLLTMKARVYKFDEKGTYDEVDIPAEYADEADRLREQLIEAIAESDDELMEKYLEGEELTEEELYRGLREGVLTNVFTPVFCGSAIANIGIRQLMDYIVACLPSPIDKGTQYGVKPNTDEQVERHPSEDEPFSAMVFKTINDPYAGKLSLMRIYSGTLKPDTVVYNPNKDEKERIGHILEMEGKKQVQIELAAAGDIVAVPKLKVTATSDTLCDLKEQIMYEPLIPLKPIISFALEPKNKGDEDKIYSGLQRLMEEDPTLTINRDEETKEMVLSGMGQIHLEVAVERLKRKFGAEVVLKEPKVPYRETIRASTKVQGKYKKQSGGRGQFGDVHIEVKPMPRGGGYEFVDKIVGGAIPRNYIPAVDKGIQEAMRTGPLTKNQVVDVQITLFDGSYHSVDSSEMAFKVAGSMAFKKAMEDCKPILLEPIMAMEVTVPDDCMGDVIGDLNSRRGKVNGVEPQANSQIIRAEVPMAEVLRYAPELRSMTSDRGMFSMEFSKYEEVPSHQTAKILAEMAEDA
ncbi:translation elongation factor 2 (EF-2/EF-G) [Malonomonas rubra DSM 5091]|uniref:Elongation factor G n=2 Tax=Malonomonas rubra DSM 5091 TaxID=1122189 RepID=A0A1M6NLT1_MALRU|nr:elongation factor G [Malonomonas rubra]SHJ96586.1 translation elongation factor 2 (EF-2/EF-G) [Malonomonas rubra DSM 5091]